MRSVLFIALSLSASVAFGIDVEQWGVRCWNGETKRWEQRELESISITAEDGKTTFTNSSGIHRHAHFVFLPELEGDFVFTIELEGGYELGFLNREGKDEMLYLELESEDDSKAGFITYTLRRNGTRYSIEKNGRVRPLVHFRFDYSEEVQITLAIKDSESVEIKSIDFQESS